jgi:hypothetical protein
MRTIAYRGNIWAGAAVDQQLWQLLLERDLLIELTSGEPPHRVILGAPHHAAPGVDRIAELWTAPKASQPGRPADETTGLTGLALLQALSEVGISARLVIAAHALDHDPNKSPSSAYWNSVFNQETLALAAAGAAPLLLFELHGAGKQRSNDLELSAGRNQITDPLLFGRALAAVLPEQWRMAVQSRPGSKIGQLFHPNHHTAELENPALSTGSLSHAATLGMLALHLEMKSFLRHPDKQYAAPRPTPEAWTLARGMAAVLRSFFSSQLL